MALRACSCAKRLPLMSLDERFVLDVVAVDAQGGHGLGQVIIELLLSFFSDLVRRVAGIASHIQRGMAAALFGDIQALVVAIKTEVRAFVPSCGLQQLIFIFGNMRIVTFNAIAHCGRMHGPFQFGRIFFSMAGDAKGLWRCRNQLYASDVFVDAYLVATGAAHGDGRMHRFALGLVLMTSKACRRIGLRIQRDRMLDRRRTTCKPE